MCHVLIDLASQEHCPGRMVGHLLAEESRYRGSAAVFIVVLHEASDDDYVIHLGDKENDQYLPLTENYYVVKLDSFNQLAGGFFRFDFEQVTPELLRMRLKSAIEQDGMILDVIKQEQRDNRYVDGRKCLINQITALMDVLASDPDALEMVREAQENNQPTIRLELELDRNPDQNRCGRVGMLK